MGPWFFFPRFGSALVWLTLWGFPTILVLWSPGPLVLWSPGPLVPWSSGPLVLWSSGSLVLVHWSSGPLVLWCPGALVPWSSGSWSFGPMVPWSWSCGPLVPWSSGLSILWSLVAVFGRIDILPITAYGASEKIGLQKNNDICGFESLRCLRSQETANTVFVDLERLRMLQITAL